MNIFNNNFIDWNKKILSLLIIISLFGYSFLIVGSVKVTQAEDVIIDLPPQNGVSQSFPFYAEDETNWNIPTGVSNTNPSQINNSAPVPSWTPGFSTAPSPVITPGQQTQAMLDQQEPPNPESCGISPSKGKWNYCLLAPLNGLIGDKTGSGKNVVEKFDISNGLSPFFFKVYRLGVMAAIGLSIVMISFGGIQLATTDTIQGTDSGRKKINAAFAGLFIALFSYVLLYTINPALVNNGSGDIFQKTEIKP
jgi:hypothetical protein